jgi:UDP-N-acetylglucosamine 3-dehydrogenase
LSKDRLSIAVIGAGYWGKKLIGEYIAISKKRDDVQLGAVVDSNKDQLSAVAKEFDLPRCLLETDASAVFKNDSIDAVHVATPNETHCSIGIAALESGKHLLLEKPMAMTLREAVKLVHKAEEQSLILQVGHIFRFNDAVIETRKLIREGVIGKPLFYDLHWETLMEPPEGRDIVFDLGPHPTDVLNYLSNDWPNRVRALGKSFLRKEPGREDLAEGVAELDGDSFASIHLSWLYPGPKRRSVSITGDAGGLEVDALNQRILLYKSEATNEHPVKANNTIEAMITSFVGSIRWREPPKNSGLVGAMTVSVLSAMRQSMKNGQFVDVLGTP